MPRFLETASLNCQMIQSLYNPPAPLYCSQSATAYRCARLHDLPIPFSWRYGSVAMRALWSEHSKRTLWRRIWVALAEIQSGHGLVTPAQAADLRSHMEEVDLERALLIEAEIQHDLMAEIRVFAEQARIGGGIIHLGATSMDVEDNGDALRVREALDLILASLRDSLGPLGLLIGQYAETPLIAFSHLQPAEPPRWGTGWHSTPRTCLKTTGESVSRE